MPRILVVDDEPEIGRSLSELFEGPEFEFTQVHRGEEASAAVSELAPDVVLLRDHFGAIVATCLAAGTVLFVFIGFVLHGIFTAREPVGIADVDEDSASQ